MDAQLGFDDAVKVLSALRPFFAVEESSSPAEGAAKDNAAGAVARIVLKDLNVVPLDQVLPILFNALPLKASLISRSVFLLFLSSTVLIFLLSRSPHLSAERLRREHPRLQNHLPPLPILLLRPENPLRPPLSHRPPPLRLRLRSGRHSRGRDRGGDSNAAHRARRSAQHPRGSLTQASGCWARQVPLV